MRPAIGDFHIFPALRLAVMSSPYITEITPEMQQKIKIFAEKGVPAQKSQKRTSFPPPKVNPRCPLQGAGIRAAGRPPYRRASEPTVRFGGSAAGPAARPRPPHNSSVPSRRGMCEGRTIGGSSLRVLSGQGLFPLHKVCAPLGTKKERPRPNAQACPHARGGMCEGMTIGGSSLRV